MHWLFQLGPNTRHRGGAYLSICVCRGYGFGNKRGSGVVWVGREGCRVLFRESGGGEGIPEVGGEIL